MRLFWKVFAVLWLATLLVGGSGFLVSRMLQQDWLLLQFHPQLRDFSEQLINRYESGGPQLAQQWLEQQRRDYRLRAQLYNSQGQRLLPGTIPQLPRFEASAESTSTRHGRLLQLGWESQRDQYQLTVHVPTPELLRWQHSRWGLLVNILLAMLVLGILSLLLSRYLTLPLARLGQAAEQLQRGEFGDVALQPLTLTSQRRDEIGDLARRFQAMAGRIQQLLGSQRQLLRDVSHELRSPLARLRIGLALVQRHQPAPDDPMWQRLDKACDQLDALIDDILALSRLDTLDQPAELFDLDSLVSNCVEQAYLLTEERHIRFDLQGSSGIQIQGWPDQLASAIDNLLRNAVRFSPDNGCITLRLTHDADLLSLQIEDQGPGVPDEWLGRLGEPFLRLPEQAANSGHGLGLTIAHRAISRHGGTLGFSRATAGGLRANIQLPAHTSR